MFQASSGNSDIHIAKAPGQEPGAFAISTNNTNQHEQTIQDKLKHQKNMIALQKKPTSFEWEEIGFFCFLICKTKYIIKIKEEKRFLYIDINLYI